MEDSGVKVKFEMLGTVEGDEARSFVEYEMTVREGTPFPAAVRSALDNMSKAVQEKYGERAEVP